MIGDKDILGWCFTLGSMSLGVFGFVYSIYASAVITHPVGAPPIVKSLRWFCRCVALALIVICVLTVFVAAQALAPATLWVLVCVLALTTVLCAVLTLLMRH